MLSSIRSTRSNLSISSASTLTRSLSLSLSNSSSTSSTPISRPRPQSSRPFSSTTSILSSSNSSSLLAPNLNLSTALETRQATEDYNQQVAQAKDHLATLGFNDITWVQQICWGDHDQFQHVNNVHYVRFFETGRMRFAELLASNMTPERQKEIIRGTGISMILAQITVRYRRPVVYPDTLVIAHAPILPLGKDRFTIRGVAYSIQQKAIVAVSTEDCVVYDYRKLGKCEMPEDLRGELEKRGIKEDGKKKY